MFEVEKGTHPTMGFTVYKIAGEPVEYDSHGCYPIKQSFITVRANGSVDVTGRFTNKKLEAILNEIVSDLKGA